MIISNRGIAAILARSVLTDLESGGKTMAEQNEFGPDLLTLTDDEGVAHTFEKLDELEKDGHKYVAMIPAYDDDSLGQPGELIILRNEVEGDEEFLVGIESEEDVYKRQLHASRIDLPHNPQLRGSEADIGDFFHGYLFFPRFRHNAGTTGFSRYWGAFLNIPLPKAVAVPAFYIQNRTASLETRSILPVEA